MKNYFIFKKSNGEIFDSREYGMHIKELPPICKPSKRVRKMIIPGRSGTLTAEEGAEVYESYNKPFEVQLVTDERIFEICEKLRNQGELIFSNEPDFAYKADFYEAFEFERFFKNWQQNQLSPEVQPFKMLRTEKRNVMAAPAGGEISGRIAAATSVPCPFFAEIQPKNANSVVSVFVNKKEIRFLPKGKSKILLNTELETLYAEDGTDLIYDAMFAELPVRLKKGENAIECNNVGKLIVTHRGWFL